MAEFGDIAQEFKHAKPPEKALIIAGIVGVVGVAWYLHVKSSASATPVQSSISGGATSPTSQVSGYPTVGANGTPVLPSGVNPVYDPNGNLVAFQNPSPTPTPTPVNQPANWYTNLLGKIPYGAKINPGGIDANGQRFWYGTNSFFYAPVGTTFAPGSQGRVWLNLPGKPSNQQGVLITGAGQVQTPLKTSSQSTQLAKTAAGVKH